MKSDNVIFSVSYGGSALSDHEMNVRDLAPALLALGELIEDANKILNNDKTKVVVNIKATEPGSVIVALSAHQDLISQAIGLFSSDGVNSVLNLLDILKILGLSVGGGGLGVIGIIKWIKNRKITNVTKLEMGDYRLELEGGEAKIVKKTEIELFKAISIRKSIETIIHTPLQKDGVDNVTFEVEGNKEIIKKEEAESFLTPTVEQELLGEADVEQNLQIVNICFQEGGKWRFSDGNANFFADILDKDFLQIVQKNEVAFAKDDVLRVKMHRKQYITPSGIKTDYTITKIMDHRSAVVQIKLPFSE